MIRCKETENKPTKKLYGNLNIGDTFLYCDCAAMIVERNGHKFAIFLGNGRQIETISLCEEVTMIYCELNYHK